MCTIISVFATNYGATAQTTGCSGDPFEQRFTETNGTGAIKLEFSNLLDSEIQYAVTISLITENCKVSINSEACYHVTRIITASAKTTTTSYLGKPCLGNLQAIFDSIEFCSRRPSLSDYKLLISVENLKRSQTNYYELPAKYAANTLFVGDFHKLVFTQTLSNDLEMQQS